MYIQLIDMQDNWYKQININRSVEKKLSLHMKFSDDKSILNKST